MNSRAIGLAALVVVGLVVGTVEARSPSHGKLGHAPVTLAGHGAYHGHHGHYGFDGPHRRPYGRHYPDYGCYRPRLHPPVVVRPYGYPYPYPSYGYMYRPHTSLHYRGHGVGFSIGF